MSTGTPASAVCGNPKTPCSGMGICDLQRKPIGSGLSIQTTVYSNATRFNELADMTIRISADQLQKLQEVRSDVYKRLVEERVFHFEPGVPLYLCSDLTGELWADAPEHISLLDPQCEIISNSDNSIDIHILPGSLGRAERGGMVGDPINSITIGSWTICDDVYGNLIFTNDVNGIIFGYGGNISFNRYSVLPSDEAGGNNAFRDSGVLVGDWHFGVDEHENLCIANITNLQSMVTFGADGQNIYVNGNAIAFSSTMSPVPSVNLLPEADTHSFGDWTITEDIDRRLCFMNAARGTAFYFGQHEPVLPACHIYVQGGTGLATTSYPHGDKAAIPDYAIVGANPDKVPEVAAP